MTTLTETGFPTLRTLTSRMDPDGGIAKIGEMLDKELPELEAIPWVESNLPDGHLMTNRTALPSATGVWRKINDGVVPTVSRTAQFKEACGRMEDFNKVDEALAEINGNSAAFRASEARATIQMFSQEFARALFYESVLDNPEKIHGLSSRYKATSGYTCSSYVLKPGTTAGVNAQSIWLINWGEDSVFGIYPKGTQAGLVHNDLGLKEVSGQTAGSLMRVWLDQFIWRCGIAVQDYRHAVRFQWDPDDSSLYDDDDWGLVAELDVMLGTILKVTERTRFHMNRTSFNKLRAQLIHKSQANLIQYMSTDNGRRLPMYCNVPIYITDALVAESAIS